MGVSINFITEKLTPDGYVCKDEINWDLRNSDLSTYLDEYDGDLGDIPKSQEFLDCIEGSVYGYGVLVYTRNLRRRIERDIEYWVEEHGRWGDFYDDATDFLRVLNKFDQYAEDEQYRLVWILY